MNSIITGGVHMGHLVKSKCCVQGISIPKFADMINTSRQNVYHIFKRKEIKHDQLKLICDVLNYDFFQHIPGYFELSTKKSRIKLIIDIDTCDLYLHSLVEKLCYHLDSLNNFSCIETKIKRENISIF